MVVELKLGPVRVDLPYTVYLPDITEKIVREELKRIDES